MNNEPIWSQGAIWGLSIAGLVVAAALIIGVLSVGGYVLDKHKAAERYAAAESRYERWSEFLEQAKAQQEALVSKASSSGGDYPAGKSLYDYRDDYDNLGDGRNAWKDAEPPRMSEYAAHKNDLHFGLAMLVPIAIVAAMTWAIMYPWKAEYHQYRVVQGTVAEVGGGQLEGGQSAVWVDWTFTINGQQYTCDDTRCGTIKQGDTAKLRCKPDYHWSGSPTRVCNFVSVKKS